MSEDQPAAAGGQSIVLSQRGQLKSFAWLSLRNGLLNLITLTLYRFWGKTEVRRRLWATTYLNEEAFEYTGRGMELFVGFLLALGALVLPFLCLTFGTQFLGPFVTLLLFPLFYVFLLYILGVGRFTAFRYLATRSAWRGVHFHMRGSAKSYGWAWLGYVLLSAITLGWFWPAADRRLAGRLWGSLSFGDRDFAFRIDEARRQEPVYLAYVLGWVLGIVGYFFLAGFMVQALGPQFAASRTGGAPPTPTLATMVSIYAAAFALTLYFGFVFAPFRAAMLRSITAGIGLDDVRFKLNVGWLDMAGLTLSNILFLIFSLGLLMPFVEARTRQFLLGCLETEGRLDLDSVVQAEHYRPKAAEGIADAFGIITI
jgi:uncharacterized membrane protein YjgN (DUF898 family)